jgi:hypothetical protein
VIVEDDQAKPVEGHVVTTQITPEYRLDLVSLTHVRQEMARVYKQARFGKLATQKATRLIYALRTIADLMEREAALAAPGRIVDGTSELVRVPATRQRLAEFIGERVRGYAALAGANGFVLPDPLSAAAEGPRERVAVCEVSGGPGEP